MYQRTIVLVVALWLFAGTASRVAAQASAPSVTIRVNLREEKAPVAPTLYGIFMEEISHAFDGGIYAELIQNRSFEEGVLPPGMKLVTKPDGKLRMELESLPVGVPTNKWDMPWPWMMNCGWDTNRALLGWSMQDEGGAKGDMKLTEANPMNAASSRSLAITVITGNSPESRVALINSGYWGIGVQAGTAYSLKFYLRAESYEGPLTASLESKDGKVLATHDFGQVKPEASWKKFTATLKSDGTDSKARFVLSFRGKGVLQVDWVSLFPPTYKNRPNGLRPDLAKLLEALKPAFIRYPGGCYVEGLSWDSAPDWRKMVCSPEERPGQWGYWQYRSTDGFGYHEFLEFCEDVGADAMYVSFAGMTVHPENNWSLDKIDLIIQRTLDAIEYAIGPTSSQWGAKRVAMGHPKSFPLKYVEVGNEHPPALYGDYYKKFHEAIKAKYPSITVIMSMYWSGLNPGAIAHAGDENIDMVDEHAYRDAAWIRTNFDYFDKYKRKPWTIYIGEYASHHAGGDWYGGLGDSVYLMMLERNGDLVKLASYAPLFCNVNRRDWGVNLIEYDSARSYAHASYYVQKVFNENRPDVNLATTVDVEPKPDPTRSLMAGKFGLGAWHTETEFKELRIYDEKDQLVYSDDFKSLENWETPGIGQWRAENGVLRQTDKGRSPAMLLLKTPELETGRVTLKARRVGGSEGFLMFFNASNMDRFLFCNYGAAGNSFSAIQDRGAPDGCTFRGGRSTPGKIENDRWYDISLTVTRDKAEMTLDGKKVSDSSMVSLPTFFATAGYDKKAKTVILKATNYNKKPMQATLQIDGATTVSATGKHIVIRGDSLTDENSLDNPRRVVPVERPLSDCGQIFSVVLPPLSVNLLKIPASVRSDKGERESS